MSYLKIGDRIEGEEVDIVLERFCNHEQDFFFKITLHKQDNKIGYIRITITDDEYLMKYWGPLAYGVLIQSSGDKNMLRKPAFY